MLRAEIFDSFTRHHSQLRTRIITQLLLEAVVWTGIGFEKTYEILLCDIIDFLLEHRSLRDAQLAGCYGCSYLYFLTQVLARLVVPPYFRWISQFSFAKWRTLLHFKNFSNSQKSALVFCSKGYAFEPPCLLGTVNSPYHCSSCGLTLQITPPLFRDWVISC